MASTAAIEQVPLLPQDLEDASSSAIPEREPERPEGTTEVKAARAPAPTAFYSQAIRTPSMLFISGQMSRDQRREGEMIRVMQPVDAIEQCMHDISAILVAGGSSFHKVVKVTVYILTDLSPAYRQIFEMVYKAYFESKPARTMVEVSKLDYDSRIALDVIALV